jgi:hypothetical protein
LRRALFSHLRGLLAYYEIQNKSEWQLLRYNV